MIGFGLFHWFMVALVLGILALPVVAVIWLVGRRRRTEMLRPRSLYDVEPSPLGRDENA